MNRSYSSATKLNFSCDTLPNIRSHAKFGSSDFKAKSEKTSKFEDLTSSKANDTQEETDSDDDQGSTDKVKGPNDNKTTHYTSQIGHLDESISKSIHIFLPDIHRKTQGQTFINHLTTPNK